MNCVILILSQKLIINMSKYLKEISFWSIGFSLPFAFWIVGHILYSDKIPSIYAVANSIFVNFEEIHLVNLLETAKVASLGILIAMLVSFIIIFFVGIFNSFEQIISPVIILLKASPAIAFVPVLMLFFGTGLGSKVTVSFMICFFPIVIGGIDGLKRVPKRLNYFSRSYTKSKIKLLFYIAYGYILESMLSGLKTAAPLSVVGAIVAEYVIGGQVPGLGGFIISNTQSYAVISRYVGIVLASFLGIVFYLVAYFIHLYYKKELHIEK